MKFDFEPLEMDPNAARQYVDARTVFIALEQAEDAAKAVRGAMVWVTAKGAEYLARTTPIDALQRYTLVNDEGFQVDFLRRMQAEDDDHPIKLWRADEEDVHVVQAKRAEQWMSAPRFSEIVAATTGEMARMDTIHPAAFRDFKRWMAGQPDRDPLKRRRDLLQADAVDAMLQERLPQLASPGAAE